MLACFLLSWEISLCWIVLTYTLAVMLFKLWKCFVLSWCGGCLNVCQHGLVVMPPLQLSRRARRASLDLLALHLEVSALTMHWPIWPAFSWARRNPASKSPLCHLLVCVGCPKVQRPLGSEASNTVSVINLWNQTAWLAKSDTVALSRIWWWWSQYWWRYLVYSYN